jgi:hypothetical protein
MLIWRFVLIVGLSTLTIAQAHKKATLSAKTPCTSQEEQTALNAIDHLKSWDDIHLAFKNFGHCDDGAIAEGYSDKVVTLLDRNWRSVTILNRLGRLDPKFRAL